MIIPIILTGMEQTCNNGCQIVQRTQIASFIAIPVQATEAKIINDGYPAMFFCVYVVNFMRLYGEKFAYKAIFATTFGAFVDLPPQYFGNISHDPRLCSSNFSNARSFALRTICSKRTYSFNS